MENALREELVPTNKTTVERVLILVLMENALRVDNGGHIKKGTKVLILVLMENTLRDCSATS